MKPSPEGNSYVIRCTLAAFNALPQETPAEIGGCSKARVGGVLVVRRRERIDGGSCITHYPVKFIDKTGEHLVENP